VPAFDLTRLLGSRASVAASPIEWPPAMVADRKHADDVVADLSDDRERELGEDESSDAARRGRRAAGSAGRGSAHR